MGELGVYLEGEDRDNFLERMLRQFDTHEEAAEWLPVSKQWIDSYSSGRQKVVRLNSLLAMEDFMENVKLELLDFDLEKRLSEGEEDVRDSELRPKLRSDWKKYMFDIFGPKELAEMTDYDRQTVNNYSPGSLNRNPPVDFWEEVNESTDSIYRDTRLSNIEASLIDLGQYGSAHNSLESSSLAETDISELFFLDKMASAYVDFNNTPRLSDTPIEDKYETIFDEIVGELERGNNYVSSANYEDMRAQKVGLAFKILDHTGILEKWSRGGRSTYRILKDIDTIEKARKLFSPEEYGLESDMDEIAEEGLRPSDVEPLYRERRNVKV